MLSSDISDKQKPDTFIFLCEDPLKISDKDLERYFSKMDPVRQKKAESYRLKKDRVLCIAAHELLCEGLRICFDLDSLPKTDWSFKPHFVDRKDISFNLSHCDHVVACAISRKNIGIDVQDDDKSLPIAVDHLMGKAISVKKADRRSDLEMSDYRSIWTHIEAYGKYLGQGLNYDIGRLYENDNVSFYEEQTERYSLCVAGSWNVVPVVRKIYL